MRELLQRFLAEERITEFGALPLDHVNIIHPHLLPKDVKTVIVLVVPYDNGDLYSDGISSYAHVKDYHRYFQELFDRLLPKFKSIYPNETFYGFADHSPIAEKDASAKAGLGIIGCHSLFVHPRYGSYVFIGSILTSMEFDCKIHEINHCNACGKCQSACPVSAIEDGKINPAQCLSAISQKKNLSDEELTLLRQHHTAWGCDVCQSVCPYNINRSFTDIPYFIKERHDLFSVQEIANMDDREFSQYTFSWRGKKRILQNLQNLIEE